MRTLGSVISSIVLLLVYSGLAVADQIQQDEPTTFILVDASGTMDGLVDDAKANLNIAAKLVRPDQQRSITFFGGSPDDERSLECGDPISIGPFTSRDDPVPEFPTLGRTVDKTSIGGAVEVILKTADDLDQIILITDQREECGADFDMIRRKNPSVPIYLLPVGSFENSELRKLLTFNAPSRSDTEDGNDIWFQGPILQFRSASDSARSNLWKKANWPERYLWVICYVCFCLSAFSLSLSFSEKIRIVKSAIDKLETFKRRLTEQSSQNDIQTEGTKLPEYLKDEEIVRSGRAYSSRSKWMLSYAIALGTPLAILDGATPFWFWGVSISVVIACLVWMFRDTSGQTENPSRWRAKNENPIIRLMNSHENKILGLGLIVLVVLIHFWVDFDRARGAAWVPLSSGFSAALTLVASTPFLSAGARWLELQSEKRSYYILGDGATREEIRRIKEEEREIQRVWEHYQEVIRRLELKNPKMTSQLSKGRREANFEIKLSTVSNRLKEHLLAAGGEEPSAAANVLYDRVLKKRDWRSLTTVILELPDLLTEEEAELWDAFEKSLKVWWSVSKIEKATFALARYVDSSDAIEDETS